MSVVIKTVGGRRYAYLAYRAGKRVVQKYLGPASDPRVRARIDALRERNAVPKEYDALFWDADPRRLRLRPHARYIIERVLEMGGLDAAAWLQRTYPTGLILDVCRDSRRISEKSRNFWNLWFEGASG